MLEIDCRTCGNCDMDRGRCKLYGDDPQKAVKACADNGFRNYCPRSSEKLINGRTPDEIKIGLRICQSIGMILGGCGSCPYKGCDGDCDYGLEDDALALIEHLEAKIPHWISVDERLPDNGKMAICKTDWFYEVLQWDEKNKFWVGMNSLHPVSFVAYWMPLPEIDAQSAQKEE